MFDLATSMITQMDLHQHSQEFITSFWANRQPKLGHCLFGAITGIFVVIRHMMEVASNPIDTDQYDESIKEVGETYRPQQLLKIITANLGSEGTHKIHKKKQT